MRRETLVQARHLERLALVYVRQSTLAQVRENRESTRLQYALEQRAEELGWPRDRIRVIDEDLGVSGAGEERRSGFARLVLEVARGKVGAVFGLDASRFSRNEPEWFDLLRWLRATETLLVTDRGVYDAGSGDDSFVLGLHGTLSAAELYKIRARMEKGKLSKAQRGELYTRVPTGYVVDGKALRKDPDEHVREAIGLVFARFQELGTARRVARELRAGGVRLPTRHRDGRVLQWRKATYSRVWNILRQPGNGRGVCVGQDAHERAFGRAGPDAEVAAQGGAGELEGAAAEAPRGVRGVGGVAGDPAAAGGEQGGGRRERGAARRAGAAAGRGDLRALRADDAGALCQRGPVPLRVCSLDGEGGCQQVWAASGWTGWWRKRCWMRWGRPEWRRRPCGRNGCRSRSGSGSCWGTGGKWSVGNGRSGRRGREYREIEPEFRRVKKTLAAEWERAQEQLEHAREVLERARQSLPERAREVPEGTFEGLAGNLRAVWEDRATSWSDRKRLLSTVLEEVVLTADREARKLHVLLRWRGGWIDERELPLRASSASVAHGGFHAGAHPEAGAVACRSRTGRGVEPPGIADGHGSDLHGQTRGEACGSGTASRPAANRRTLTRRPSQWRSRRGSWACRCRLCIAGSIRA